VVYSITELVIRVGFWKGSNYDA